MIKQIKKIIYLVLPVTGLFMVSCGANVAAPVDVDNVDNNNNKGAGETNIISFSYGGGDISGTEGVSGVVKFASNVNIVPADATASYSIEGDIPTGFGIDENTGEISLDSGVGVTNGTLTVRATGTGIYTNFLETQLNYDIIRAQIPELLGFSYAPTTGNAATLSGSGQDLQVRIAGPGQRLEIAPMVTANMDGNNDALPTYSVDSGSLPAGLSLDRDTGVISGEISTIGGTNLVEVRATPDGTTMEGSAATVRINFDTSFEITFGIDGNSGAAFMRYGAHTMLDFKDQLNEGIGDGQRTYTEKTGDSDSPGIAVNPDNSRGAIPSFVFARYIPTSTNYGGYYPFGPNTRTMFAGRKLVNFTNGMAVGSHKNNIIGYTDQNDDVPVITDSNAFSPVLANENISNGATLYSSLILADSYFQAGESYRITFTARTDNTTSSSTAIVLLLGKGQFEQGERSGFATPFYTADNKGNAYVSGTRSGTPPGLTTTMEEKVVTETFNQNEDFVMTFSSRKESNTDKSGVYLESLTITKE